MRAWSHYFHFFKNIFQEDFILDIQKDLAFVRTRENKQAQQEKAKRRKPKKK